MRFLKICFLSIAVVFLFGFSVLSFADVFPINKNLADRLQIDAPDLAIEFLALPAFNFNAQYQPEIISNYRPIVGLSNNATFSKGIAGKINSFLTNQNQLRLAIDYFLEGNFNQSTELLNKIANLRSEVGKLAYLWLNFIQLNNNVNISLEHIDRLQEDTSYLISGQAYYLSMLKSFLQRDFSSSWSTYKHWLTWYAKNNFNLDNSKLDYLAFLSLVANQNSDTALSFGKSIFDKYPYTEWYPEFLSHFGDLYMQKGAYLDAGFLYQKIADNFIDNLDDNTQLWQKLLWAYSLSGQTLEFNAVFQSIPNQSLLALKDFDYFNFKFQLIQERYDAALSGFESLAADNGLKTLAVLDIVQSPKALKYKPFELIPLVEISAAQDEIFYISFARSQLYFWQGDYTTADEILTDLLDRTNASSNFYPSINHNLGLIKLTLDMPQEALTYFYSTSYASKSAVPLPEHVYYAWYRLNDFQSILEADQNSPNPDKSLMIKSILANAYLATNQYEKAFTLLKDVFFASGDIKYLQSALNVVAFNGEFDLGIELINQVKQSKLAVDISAQEIDFLLKNQQPLKAEALLANLPQEKQSQADFLILQARLDLASENYQKILSDQGFAGKAEIFKQTNLHTQYSFLLAEAYYKTGEFKQAEENYLITVEQTNDANLKNLSLYNYLQSISAQRPASDFFTITKIKDVLKMDIFPETQFLLVKMLAEQMFKQGDYESAKNIYSDYTNFFDYKQDEINLEFLKNSFTYRKWQDCFKTSDKTLTNAQLNISDTAKVDIWISGSICAAKLNQLDWVLENQPQVENSNYRTYDKDIVLAFINLQQGKLAEAKNLIFAYDPARELSNFSILHSFILKKIDFLDKKQLTLSMPDDVQHLKLGIYSEAMKLYAYFLESKNDYAGAVDSMLKAVYLDPSVSDDVDNKIYLARLLAKSGKLEDAISLAKQLETLDLNDSQISALSDLID